jgi:hypothetical protein
VKLAPTDPGMRTSPYRDPGNDVSAPGRSWAPLLRAIGEGGGHAAGGGVHAGEDGGHGGEREALWTQRAQFARDRVASGAGREPYPCDRVGFGTERQRYVRECAAFGTEREP